MSASTKLSVACIKARREVHSLGDKVTKQPSVSGIKPEEDAKKLTSTRRASPPST
jgi:hypothetical protein